MNPIKLQRPNAVRQVRLKNVDEYHATVTVAPPHN